MASHCASASVYISTVLGMQAMLLGTYPYKYGPTYERFRPGGSRTVSHSFAPGVPPGYPPPAALCKGTSYV